MICAHQKAVPARTKTAATNTLLPQIYRHATAMSTAALSAPALGWLVLYLTSRDLPDQEQRIGWLLVERWAGELVSAKRAFMGTAS